MALTCDWLSDRIRRYKADAIPAKFPAALDFDCLNYANPWGDSASWKEFAIGEFLIHQLTIEFNEDMYDRYIKFQPSMYETPGATPDCLWKIHVPDALDPIWLNPYPITFNETNGWVTYLGIELSSKNILFSASVNSIGTGITSMVLQFTTVAGMYMSGLADDELLTNKDWLIKPSRYGINADPLTNVLDGLPDTVYASAKWYFSFYLQILDTDDVTIIPLNTYSTCQFPFDVNTQPEQQYMGRYYNHNNNAVNPYLIHPQFIFKENGIDVTDLNLLEIATFTFKLDFGIYIPKGAVAYLIMVTDAEMDNTITFLENYTIQNNGVGYRVIENAGGTGTNGPYFLNPTLQWVNDTGTIYKFSFDIDNAQFIDIYQRFRMVVLAYSRTNEIFNSYISRELKAACLCGVIIYNMAVRHLDCEHTEATVAVELDFTYNGIVDVDGYCAKPINVLYVWTDQVTIFTSRTDPNAYALPNDGNWTFSVYLPDCSETPVFTTVITIQHIIPAFAVVIIQPCALDGVGTITASTTNGWIWVDPTFTLVGPGFPLGPIDNNVAVPDLAVGTYEVCLNTVIGRETIFFNTIVTPPEIQPIMRDISSNCVTCNTEIIIGGLDFNVAVTQGTCDCGATAVVYNITPAGTYTYLWSTGATTISVSGLCPGDYWVRVKNNAECSSVEKFTVTANGSAYDIDVVDEPAWWPVPCNCLPCKTFITTLESKAYQYILKVLPHMHDFTDLGYNSDLFGKADCVDVNYNKANDFIYLGIYLMLMEIDKAQYVLNDPESAEPSNEYLRAIWFISCIESYFKCHNVNIQELLDVFNAESENTPMDNYIVTTQKKRPYPPYTPSG